MMNLNPRKSLADISAAFSFNVNDMGRFLDLPNSIGLASSATNSRRGSQDLPHPIVFSINNGNNTTATATAATTTPQITVPDVWKGFAKPSQSSPLAPKVQHSPPTQQIQRPPRPSPPTFQFKVEQAQQVRRLSSNESEDCDSVGSPDAFQQQQLQQDSDPMDFQKDEIELDAKAGFAAQQTRNRTSSASSTTSTSSRRSSDGVSGGAKRNSINPFLQHGLTDEDVQTMPYASLAKVMQEMSFDTKLVEDVKAHRKRLQNRKHVKKYSKKQKHCNMAMQAVTGHLEQELINLRAQLSVANARNDSLTEQLNFFKAENGRINSILLHQQHQQQHQRHQQQHQHQHQHHQQHPRYSLPF